MADVHVEAEKDYVSGMKYKDIAEKYETTINTVKSWKKRYGWERKKGAHKKEGAHKSERVQQLQKNDGTEETLKNTELNDKQQLFCIYYTRSYNATQSYMKAYECNWATANVCGPRLLGNVRVKEEIERLKKIKREQILAGEEDLLELQMRIAFSDIGNYLEFSGRMVKLQHSEMTDTQLIKSVKEGKDGISIELKDSQKALDWLTNYFEMNPMNKHKKEFDKRKLELDLLRLEMQTKESGSDEPAKDNFLDALNQSAGEVWQDE